MAIVNFAIPKTLEKRIQQVIKKKGFSSKAEFFRFSAVHFIDIIDKPMISENERFNYLTKTISQEISEKYRGKKLPSVKKQLADV